MIYNIDEELEKYELAKTNFSNVPADKWESTEVVTDENGRTYTAGVKNGMLFELQPNEEETTNTETQEAAVIPNAVEDIAKGSVRGMSEAGRNTTSFGSNVLGAPGDIANFIAKTYPQVFQNIAPYITPGGVSMQDDVDVRGTEFAKNPNKNFDMFLGGEDINNRIQQGLTWVGDNIMGNNAVDQWAAEDFNNETLGQVSELIAQFATPAIPAAKVTKAADLLITGMQSLNPFKRGLIWGAIADAAAFDENVDTLTGELAKYVAGQTPEERTAFGNAIVDVFEKNPEHAGLVNQLKGSLEGLVLGSGIEVFMRAAVMGSKLINWKELFNRIEFDPNTVSSGGLGGISLKKKPTDTEPGIIAFHGSGADFDEFKLEKIGTGEGAQVFGHGLYFSDSEDIAKFYRKQILYDNVRKGKLNVKYKNKLVPQSDTAETEASSEIRMVSQIVEYMNGTKGNSPDPKNAKADLIYKIELQIGARQNFNLDGTPIYRDAEEIELNKLITDSLENDLKTLEKINPEDIIVDIGKVYKVNIKTVMDDLIDYDKNLKEQNKKIQKILKPYYELYSISETADFGTLLESSYRNLPRDKFSEELSKEGIKGIKYKAGQLSGIDSDKTNFVIFDDKIIDIMAKMGIVGPMAISAIKNNKEQTQDNSI